VRAGGLVATAALAVAAASATQAQAQTSPTIFTVATNQGPVSATQADLDHWLAIARRTTQGATTYSDLEIAAMDTLLNGVYLRAEAADQGVTVTDREVSRSLNQQRHKTFKTVKAYHRYLKRTGQTRQDLLEQTRQDLLATKLKEKAIQPALRMVTPLAVADYVRHHPRFIPERRDVLIIFTAHRQQARAAYDAVIRGLPFPDAARQYSLDEVTKARGGFDPKLTRTSVEPKLAKQIFSAHERRLEGPVHTKFGYYVFAVTRVYPRRAVTHARQVETAKQQMRTNAAKAGLTQFAHAFNTKWRARTTCAPQLTFNPSCSNQT
jgi:parvulin-like peptidyl-prolyl isomerase